MTTASESEIRKPGRPRSAQADREILQATLEELAAVGYEALTIEAVAARARVGKTTIYRRWPSKMELVIEAISMIHAETPIIDTGNFREDVVSLLRSAFQLRSELVEQLVVKVIGEVESNPEVFQAFMARHVTPRFQAIFQMIDRAKERGELRQDVEPALVMGLLAGPYFFQILFAHVFPMPTPSPDAAERLVDAILHGIGGP